MTTGRTLKRWTRVYIDGRDMSGYTREIGPLSVVYDEVEQLALSDGVRGALPNQPDISIGTLNGLFDNTATSGIHAALSSAGVSRDVMVAVGIQAAPAEGDPVFMGAFNHNGYQIAPAGGDIALTVPFGKTSPAESMTYEQAWGRLLHASSAATAANTAAGVDDSTSSALGGWMMYQISAVAGTGTVAISVDESTNNTDFTALDSAASGDIAHTAVPCAGIVKLSKTAEIQRYLRWQMSLTGITSCTFALAFVRGR